MTRHDPLPEDLAREWAGAIGTTAFVAMSPAGIQELLGDLTERLGAALSGHAVDTRVASDVGARLVASGFIGPQSLSRTVEVLVRALLIAPTEASTEDAVELFADRVVELLGALVAGYAEALRHRILDQQEEVKKALLAARRHIERDLRASEEQFRRVFIAAPVGIAISELDGPIVRTNPRLWELLGYSEGALSELQLSELFSPDDLPTLQRLYQRLLAGQDLRIREEFLLRRKDGGWIWSHLAATVLRDSEQRPRYLVTMVEDITDVHLLTERLNHQTLHDMQTGLPNRQYFVSHLEKVLGLLEPSAIVTLLQLDLDGFSAINDGLGHRFGDQLLDVVARRLESVVADQQAMVTRLDGDEFAILIQHGLRSPGESAPDVGWMAEAINAELAEPLYLDGIRVAVTASIGIVQRQADGTEEPAELLRAAGATLRRARGMGTRQWAAFHADIDAADRAELRMAAAMPGALETGELQVDYQPMMTLADRRLVGIEAMLRWQHPQLGVLPHERCMQVAQQSGVGCAVGQWLLRTAAEQARSWRHRMGDGVPPLAVNLTPAEAQDPDLVALLVALLAQVSLQPAELELRSPVAAVRTAADESVGEAGGQAEDNLGVLAELGVRTGLHEFGGGIGGLACLAELPVCAVRIAQAVARRVAGAPSAVPAQVVQTMVPMIRHAGVSVIACGVDTEEQAGWWRGAGADCALGALFGKPGPPQDIEHLLSSGNS